VTPPHSPSRLRYRIKVAVATGVFQRLIAQSAPSKAGY
jgi:hypothetical protein